MGRPPMNSSLRSRRRPRSGFLLLLTTIGIFLTNVLFPVSKVRFPSMVVALSPMLQRQSRYFRVEGHIPPLQSVDDLPIAKTFRNGLEVCYTNDPSVVALWLENNVPHHKCSFLGFDVESVPSHYQSIAAFDGPATVQLANPESCLVVHLARSNGKGSLACVPVLQSVLCDETIVKVGCQIDQDMVDLMSLCGVSREPRSRFDLGRLRSPGTPTPGLKKLSRDILGLELPKPKRIARSNWSRVPLTERQVLYSARDAWVAAAIAQVLAERDPRFGAGVLANELRSQQSLVEAERRMRRRKRAKSKLSMVLSKYKSRLHMRKNVSPEEKRAVERLDRIIFEKILEKEDVFGFSWDHERC